MIVPFDRLHIRNAFQTEDIKDTSNEDAKCATIYGDDFINKTFYIVYHVSPPILSGWKHYFVHQWKEAFGNEYVLDNAILQVYDMLTEEHTPRKIVAFINEFVTMKRIADEAIPNKYIALFIFGRSKISQHPMKEILSPSYLGSLDFLYKDDRDMPGFISSLYYQLPVHEAMDVVYARQFTRELDENALNSIAIMKKSGVDKFTAILNHAIAEVTNVGNAAMALQALFGEETNSNIKNFWECLYQKDKSQHREIKQYTPYHKVLLAHISDKATYAKDLIDGYHNAFNNETDVKAYITGIDELAKVKDFDIYTILEEIEKDISPKQFVELVDEEKFNYDQYGLTCENKTLDHYLSNLSLDEWNNLTIIPYLYSKCLPLSSLQMKIEESLKNNNLNACVVFPSGLLGVNDFTNTNMTVLIKKILNEKVPLLTEGGYDFVDVRDVARGVINACTKGKKGEGYILSGEYVTIKKIADLVCEYGKSKPIKKVISIKMVKNIAFLFELYYRLRKTTPLFTSYSLYTLNANSNFTNAKAKKDLDYQTRNIKCTIKDLVNEIKSNE